MWTCASWPQLWCGTDSGSSIVGHSKRVTLSSSRGAASGRLLFAVTLDNVFHPSWWELPDARMNRRALKGCRIAASTNPAVWNFSLILPLVQSRDPEPDMRDGIYATDDHLAGLRGPVEWRDSEPGRAAAQRPPERTEADDWACHKRLTAEYPANRHSVLSSL
jgi:hypothetical protein